MPRDLFEQLASAPVPPVPVAFDRALHERINRRLLVGQLLDLGLKASIYTALHFGRAVAGVLMFTMTGKFETRSHALRGNAGPDAPRPEQ